jgi:hypothetical protein
MSSTARAPRTIEVVYEPFLIAPAVLTKAGSPWTVKA